MRILVFDDHEAIRMIVKQQVSEIVPTAEIILCGTLDCAKRVISEGQNIHFVICDLEINAGCSTVIPEMSFKNKIPYMVYTSHVNKVLINELMTLNVNSYASKISGMEALRQGIVSLLVGKPYQCPLVVSTIESTDNFKETEKLTLTPGQKVVLDVVAKGFNREEAAKILKIKMATLNNHIARARELNDCENFEELLRRYRFWDHLSS